MVIKILEKNSEFFYEENSNNLDLYTINVNESIEKYKDLYE